MRLLRRRDGGAAVATYAAVLDGAHLWLDVEGVEGQVSVRDTASGAVTGLGPHPHDLGGLTRAAYDVLVGRAVVELAERTSDPLTRTPLSPDGTTQWEVVSDEGRLRLLRHDVAATAELVTVGLREERLHLEVRPPGPVRPGTHLLLLDTDDRILATLPVTAHDGPAGVVVEALVGVDDLPAGFFGVLRVAVGTEESWLRVRRRANDLTDPNHAVLLPELRDATDDATEQPRARLRWNPDGLLALRSFDPDPDPDPEAEG